MLLVHKASLIQDSAAFIYIWTIPITTADVWIFFRREILCSEQYTNGGVIGFINESILHIL